MKKYSFKIIALIVILIWISACKKTSVVSFNAAFEIVKAGKTPNAQVGINNNTIAGSTFHWTFSTDSLVLSSNKKWPDVIIVTKPCILTVTLEASDGKETQTVMDTVHIF